MTEQTEQSREMTLEEIRAEIERVDAETAKIVRELLQEEPSQGRGPSRASAVSSAASSAASAGEGAEALAREASVARRNLIREYEHLDSDERFTEEHRIGAAWKAYDKAKPVIEEKAHAARESLLKSADYFERSSIPFPGGQDIRTQSVELLSLTQGERARIVERLAYENPTIARMKAAGKKTPKEAKPSDILREEYAHGLDVGGPQGGAICRATIQIAQDRGIEVHSLVDEHRRNWQRTHLQNAQEARIQASNIYTRVPLPNYPRPGGIKSLEEASAGKQRSALGLKRKGATAAAQKPRRPHWK